MAVLQGFVGFIGCYWIIGFKGILRLIGTYGSYEGDVRFCLYEVF